MRKSKRKNKSWVSVIALIVIMLAGYYADRLGLIDPGSDTPTVETYAPVNGGDSIAVHYIDVGQGDCELILTSDGSMLIDSGEYDYVNTVIDYLEAQGVEYIDVLVATHPHSDHIGGMAEIIKQFGVGTVIMPRASSNSVSYEKMLLMMKERGLKAHVPEVGERLSLGGAEFITLAPNSDDYESLNNYSVVLKMIYGDHSFIFTGDAESLSEKEMLQNGLDLSANFLKVGHHGSKTSSTEDFLSAVEPRLAFIGTGKGNSYGHPHQGVVDRLNAHDVEIYRTDRNGNIVIETDGDQYRITTER